jgi:protein-tyrosine-phosphatase
MALTRARQAGLGMLGLGIGYFISYTPYTGLARGVSDGLLPGVDRPVRGLELLPPAALGLLTSMVVFLLVSGWWRQARTRVIAGRRVPFPGRETAASACFMAVIVGTTTLNFTFVGVSILFVLVLERLETLVIAPLIDVARRRKIRVYSWAALALCGAAAVVTLADVNNYHLTLAVALSILGYLAGYTGRFRIMSRHAKTGGPVDRRYFVEEHMTTPVVLVAALGLFALLGQESLRAGFTTFLTTPAAAWAFGIGVCYEALFIFTTHIFLDRREFAFGMPVHVCASLLAGVAATFILRAMYGTAPPSAAQLVAGGCVIVAAFALSYPTLRARFGPPPLERLVPNRNVLTFVCGGNAIRSPMAEAVARAELAGSSWQVRSAGVSVAAPGGPISPLAVDALRRLGIPVPRHASTGLTAALCEGSTLLYCMTAAHREAILALAPQARGRVFCLDPAGDLAEPDHGNPESFVDCARRIRTLVRDRLDEQGGYSALAAAGGA